MQSGNTTLPEPERERGDGGRGLVHDLFDQVESVLGAFAETDEGYVRPFSRRDTLAARGEIHALD
jgi:hypothetical protein